MSSRPRDLPGRPLTPKQQRFIDEYLGDLNATQAYLRAGYRAKTNTVARVESSKLLTKPNIQAVLQAARQRLSERTEVTQDTVIYGLLSEAQYKGEGSTHGARVSAWGHLAKHLLPERPEPQGRPEVLLRVVYQDRPRIVDGLVVEERKALKDGSG